MFVYILACYALSHFNSTHLVQYCLISHPTHPHLVLPHTILSPSFHLTSSYPSDPASPSLVSSCSVPPSFVSSHYPRLPVSSSLIPPHVVLSYFPNRHVTTLDHFKEVQYSSFVLFCPQKRLQFHIKKTQFAILFIKNPFKHKIK